MVAGTCLCGAVRYEVEGPFANLMHCHCSMCRKHHGAAFASFVSAPARGFRWTAGEDRIARYESSPGTRRGFCATCGSVAPLVMGNDVYLPAGNLQGDIGDAGGMHVFAGSKAPWHTIADRLPRHDGEPGASDAGNSRTPAPVAGDATRGSCLCGAVTFEVRGAPARFLYCHCSRCRRARSAAHASNLFYPLTQFAWRSGESLVRTYKLPEAERFTTGWCVQCGGGVPVVRDGVPFALVPAGVLDADPGARPQANINVASQAAWYDIADDLPRFAAMPPP